MNNSTILVPLDGSKFGEWAVHTALGLARRLRARVELVSVFEEEPDIPFEHRVPLEQIRWYLEGLTNRIGEVSDVPVASTVLNGPVTQRLEEHAERAAPDLVVMSTHGRGPLSRARLGSVADRLVRRVSMPVLLLRPVQDAEPQLTDRQQLRQILVALDGSDVAEASLDWVKRIAQAAAASCTLLRIIPPSPALPSPYLPHTVEETDEALKDAREAAETYLAAVETRLQGDGLNVQSEVVVHSRPELGILSYAREQPVDLIAIATRGRGGVSRLVLGSVADKVVRAAAAPVLVTPPPSTKPGVAVRASAAERRSA